MTSSGQIKSVGVFMGAEFGNEKMFSNKATELGKYLAGNNYRLVYGGGKDGLMGIVAMSVMENGGRVLGITPSNLAETSIDADQITELVQTPDMNTRKQLMIDQSDAFIALPGGFGTLEEIAQTISWAKIDLHERPLALFNINGFYDTLWQWIEEAVSKDFVPPFDMKYVYRGRSIDDIFEYFDNFEFPSEFQNPANFV